MECLVCGYQKNLRRIADPKTGKTVWFECEGRHAVERSCKSCKTKFQHPKRIFCEGCLRSGKWKKAKANKKNRKPKRVRPGRS